MTFLTVELYTHTTDPQHAAEASVRVFEQNCGDSI